MLKNVKPFSRYLVFALKVVIPLIALSLIWQQIHNIHFNEIKAIFDRADWLRMALGGLTMLLAIAVMGFYDVLAFQLRDKQKLSISKRWLIGTMTFGWSNFIGFGPAIRAWLYSRDQYTFTEIGKGLLLHYAISFAGLLAWVCSLIFLKGGMFSYIFAPLLLCIVFSLILKVLFTKIPYTRNLSLDVISAKVYLQLAVVTFLDWGLSLLAFYFVIDAFHFSAVDFQSALRTGVLGWFAGIVSMIPGGLGTADAVWLQQLSGLLNNTGAAAAIVFAERLVLYALPWLLAVGMFYFFLLAGNSIVRGIQRHLIAIILAVQSAILLFSVATPYPLSHLQAIASLMPLHFIEGSHLVATIFGFSLLFLLHGIHRGYRNAYRLALSLLSICLFANLLNGLDLFAQSTTILTLLLLCLSRREFTRKGHLNIGFGHTMLVGLAGLIFLWIMGFVAFDNVPYRPELWQQFELHMQASRFLRSATVVTIIFVLYSLRQAFRSRFQPPSITAESIQKVEDFVIKNGLEIESFLVGGGDKYSWWYGDTGFILYQIKGNKLLVFKNPQIIAGGDKKALLRAFMDFCEEADLEPYFSSIAPQWMEHLHQFGFYFTKFAEEAIVDIDSYDLNGHSKAAFRRTIKQVEKQKMTFAVQQPPFDTSIIEQLRVISDAWLNSKGGHELQFNACYFSPAYIQRHPIALVKTEHGEIIAFVNLLSNPRTKEATFDFMRYLPQRVDNLMDYLFVKTFLYLGERGYQRFSLGNAPMTEVGNTETARSLEKLMLYASEHAEHFYNYKGLRYYKGKFKPEWQARFLAYRYPWNALSALKLSINIVQARSKATRTRIENAKFAKAYSEFSEMTQQGIANE